MSIFRTNYKKLTEEEIQHIEAIKNEADKLYALINGEYSKNRETSLALTKLEECVMWAVKGCTR